MNMLKKVQKKIFLSLTISILIFSLFGCGGLAKRNNQSLNQLKVGQSEEVVLSFMGKPQKIQATGSKQYWLYRIGYFGDEYETFVPVLFVDGKVQGWGKQYLKEIGITPEAKSNSGGGGLIVAAPAYNPPSMAPFMTNPSSGAVRGNTQPFQQSPPQQPIQNPSINCNPNGIGGFRCQ